MPFGIVNFGGPLSTLITPSPMIWGDCLFDVLKYNSQGFVVDKVYEGDDVTLPGLSNYTPSGASFTYDTVLDNVIDMNGSGTGNSTQVAMFTRPLGTVALGSGKKLWAETSVAFNSTGGDTSTQGYFFGFVTGIPAGPIQSTLLTNASTMNGSTSLFGFWLHGGKSSTLDAIYQKGTPATTGSVSTVLADVMNNPANNPNPGNLAYVPATPPGNLSTGVFVKLGVRYDGDKFVSWYVNGSPVAKFQVDGNWNQASTYAAGQWLYSNASTNALTVKNAFFRAASQIR